MKNPISIHTSTVYSNADNTGETKNITNELAMSELKKIYWHEKELLIAIPILLSTANSHEMVESLIILGQYTKEHIEQLETNFPFISKVA